MEKIFNNINLSFTNNSKNDNEYSSFYISKDVPKAN